MKKGKNRKNKSDFFCIKEGDGNKAFLYVWGVVFLIVLSITPWLFHINKEVFIYWCLTEILIGLLLVILDFRITKNKIRVLLQLDKNGIIINKDKQYFLMWDEVESVTIRLIIYPITRKSKKEEMLFCVKPLNRPEIDVSFGNFIAFPPIAIHKIKRIVSTCTGNPALFSCEIPLIRQLLG